MDNFFGLGWGMLSAILTFVSAYSYMRAIYKRELKRPVIPTLSLWLLIGFLLFLTSIKLGASLKTTLLPILMGVINPAIVLVLSLKYGEYTWKTIDVICILVCLLSLVIWQTTESAMLGFVGGIIADVIAAMPLIIKSWRDPRDEPVFPWVMFVVASAINILAVDEWKIEYWLFPVYMTMMGVVISVPLILHTMKVARK